MPNLLFQAIFVLSFLYPTLSNAQEVWQLMGARDFQQMKTGPEKTRLIRDIEYKGWYQVDTFLGLDKKLEYHKVDLAPFVDDQGESVFLITDVSPEFPGGASSQKDYFQNFLGDLLAKPDGETQNTLFVKFSVKKNGEIEAVEAAQPFSQWVSAATAQRCIDAVREMPPWSPGIFKDRPVKVKMLISFGLRE